MKPLLPLIEKPIAMKHPIPFHYKLFMYKAWLGMLWIDACGYCLGLNWKQQRNQSNVCYKAIIKMAQTHGVKPYDYSKFYALLILLFSLILFAVFLWECFVKFYLQVSG